VSQVSTHLTSGSGGIHLAGRTVQLARLREHTTQAPVHAQDERDQTWRVEFDEIVVPRCVEMERRSADGGMDTLTLLSLTTPFLQLIDAEARGFAEDELVLVLTEFDSTSWDVRAVDERALSELRHHYPGAEDL
jgi:hypothetical protein